VLSAGTIVQQMVDEAEAIIARLGTL
jgi:hypothetical protein